MHLLLPIFGFPHKKYKKIHIKKYIFGRNSKNSRSEKKSTLECLQNSERLVEEV